MTRKDISDDGKDAELFVIDLAKLDWHLIYRSEISTQSIFNVNSLKASVDRIDLFTSVQKSAPTDI